MATVLRLVLLVIIFCGSAPGARTQELDESVNQEAGLAPLPQVANYGICKSMVEIHGYVCQEHTVTTEDGYILSLQRIPAGRSSGDTPQERRPVLLQHGVLVDGAIWLLNLPHQSLAFILADGGFDVWIANSRVTKRSRGHTSLSSDDPAYWDWSWDQLVEYDLPATFQYVHHQTGKKIYYVGHSQGTLIALASFSQEKLLNLLKSAALLSPIAYLGQVPCPLARSAAEVFIAETFFWLGVDEFDPKGKAVDKLLKAICNKPGINCYNLFTSFTVIRGGSITMYDYGDKDKNVKHYGQPTPPVYNMSGIPSDIPLYLSYGGKDKLSDVNDVQALLDSLKDHDRDKLVVQYQEDYAHADFVMAMNAKQMVYDSLMAFFRLH